MEICRPKNYILPDFITQKWYVSNYHKINGENLRNRIITLKFATDWFRNLSIRTVSKLKTTNTIHRYKMRRDVFQAIADPTRRAIIGLIALQAMTPNALAVHFDTSRQAVSKHLKILTECELVKQEQQGREIYYSLEVSKMKEIDNWLEQFRKIWENRFNALDKILVTLKKQ